MNSNNIRTIVAAAALASGLAATGVAASAQTTAPAPVQSATNTTVAANTPGVAITTQTNASTNDQGTTVGLRAQNPEPSRFRQLQLANDEARRVEFRNLGFNL